MGAIANMAPELYAGVVADVPFVDTLNTMLDASLPLTPPEWLEWGDPIRDAEAFAVIRGYSPYDNVKPQNYPAILALAGLADPRVTYLGAGEMGGQIARDHDRRRADPAAHRHGRRPRRSARTVRPARRHRPHLRLRHRRRRGRGVGSKLGR